MMVTPIRSGAVASTSSSVMGIGSTSSGFSQLVSGAATSGISQYNADIASMAAQNQRMLEYARANGLGAFSGAGTNGMGQYSTNLAEMSAQMNQMLNVQIAMQRENLVFSSISNVLKTKHDTLKNTIGNIR